MPAVATTDTGGTTSLVTIDVGRAAFSFGLLFVGLMVMADTPASGEFAAGLAWLIFFGVLFGFGQSALATVSEIVNGKGTTK